MEEEKAKGRITKDQKEGGRGKIKNSTAKVQQSNSRQPTAAEAVAKDVGVSPRTIYDAKKVT
jgi:hypothetical protein